MNFWKTINYKWNREELKKWTSVRRTVYLLLPLFVYFVVNDIAEVFMWVLLEFLIKSGGDGRISFLNRNASTIQGMVNGLVVLAGTGFVFPAVKNELQEEKGPEKAVSVNMVTAYCFLAAFACCTAVGVNIFFYQSGFTGSSAVYERVQEAQYGVQFVIGLILYGMVSPLAEEAVFRGLLYNRMKRCFNLKTALVVSALLFGIYHGNPVQAAYGTILGFLIAYTYEMYESFAAPLLFHAAANVSVYAMTYRSNQALADRKIALITGTITIAAAILIFIYIKKKLIPAMEKA